MQITDRAIARNQEWRAVKITEVNPATNHFAAEDQYGTPMLLTLMGGVLQEIPTVGEQWSVSRQGSDWRLENRLETTGTQLPITSLKPGDVRIETFGTIYVTGSKTGASIYGAATYGSSNYAGFSFRITRDTEIIGSLEVSEGIVNAHLVGIATAPTPPTTDNSTQIATTAYVQAQDYATTTFVVSRVPQFTASTFSSGPPDSSSNNDIWIATDVDTDGTVWQFRYNAGSASAFKWEFIGGPPLYTNVDTAQTTASLTYVDLATVGPQLLITRAGDYLVQFGALVSAPTGSTDLMSFAITGGTTYGPNDGDSADYGNTGASAASNSIMTTRPIAGINALSTITAKYRVNGGTHTWQERWMTIIPVRIS
jgi:hypothetical protein